MFPIVDGLENEFSGQVSVTRLNAAETDVTQLMNDYGVRGHPSFVVLDDNNDAIQQLIGSQSEDILRAAMTAVAIGE